MTRDYAIPQAAISPPADAGLLAAPQAEVSIVVACRNEVRHIREFLDSVLHQDFDGFDWEIIIADGMSDDGTREVLHEYSRIHLRLKVIDNLRKIAPAGLNAAIRTARGEYILRMDAHTEYAPDYVRQCMQALAESKADNVGGPARTKADGLLAHAIAAAYHSRFSTGGARFHDDQYSGYADTVPYGCWRKATLERLGLFDEELVRNQDDELNLRLTRAGGRIWQSAKIVSYYRPRASLRSLWRQYFQYGYWKVAVIRKHRLPASWRHLAPAGFVLVAAGLLSAAVALAAMGQGRTAVFAFLLWAGMLLSYMAVCLAVSIAVARRHGWAMLLLLPVVFSTFHFSYGCGFLVAAIHHVAGRRNQLRDSFAGITR